MEVDILPPPNFNAPEKTHNNLPKPVHNLAKPYVRMPSVPPTSRSGPAPRTTVPFGMIMPILTPAGGKYRKNV